MTKTPLVSRFQFGSQQRRGSAKNAQLLQPFLSPEDGKLHTTGTLERSSMGRRWLVLVLCSFFMACNYYCYDNPAALYGPLRGRALAGIKGDANARIFCQQLAADH